MMKMRKTAYNKVLPKTGLNGFDWTFVQGPTSMLRLNFSTKNPRLRQYPTIMPHPMTTVNKNTNRSKI